MFHDARTIAAGKYGQCIKHITNKAFRRGIAQGDTCIDHANQLCGYEYVMDEDMDAKLDQAWAKGVNARQCIAAIKGPYGGGVKPTFPEEIKG